jgi:hypothetical protein
MKNIKLLFLITLLLNYSCNDAKDIVKISKQNKQNFINEGEWFSDLDSMSGISVRNNKIAFFKNFKFSSDDIYEFEIIDSFHVINKNEKKIGEFLFLKGYDDSLVYRIMDLSDKNLKLKIDEAEKNLF